MFVRNRRRITHSALLLSVVCFQGVAAEPQRIPKQLPPQLIGVWQQVDDGRYLVLTKDHADFFDYTSQVCYRVAPDSTRALHESFELYALSDSAKTLKLWQYDFGERFERFYYNEFLRVDGLPDGTLFAPDKDVRFKNPKFVAQLICQHFDEHFPFFEQRQFPWQARKQVLLDTIRETSQDRELFDALCECLAGLGDSHTRIYWTEEKQPFKSGRTRVLTFLESAYKDQDEIQSVPEFGGFWQRTVRKEIEALLVDGKMLYAANDRIRWGVLQGNIGYIENEFLTGFAAAGTRRPKEIEQLEEELDRVVQALNNCDALILDLSYNAGGFDQARINHSKSICRQTT